jgi:hypothetical protein
MTTGSMASRAIKLNEGRPPYSVQWRPERNVDLYRSETVLGFLCETLTKLVQVRQVTEKVTRYFDLN